METFTKLSVPLKFVPHLEVEHTQLLQPHRESDRLDICKRIHHLITLDGTKDFVMIVS